MTLPAKRTILISEDAWVVSLKCAKQPVQMPELARCLHDGPCGTAVYACREAADRALAGHAFRSQCEVRPVTVVFYAEEQPDAR